MVEQLSMLKLRDSAERQHVSNKKRAAAEMTVTIKLDKGHDEI